MFRVYYEEHRAFRGSANHSETYASDNSTFGAATTSTFTQTSSNDLSTDFFVSVGSGLIVALFIVALSR